MKRSAIPGKLSSVTAGKGVLMKKLHQFPQGIRSAQNNILGHQNNSIEVLAVQVLHNFTAGPAMIKFFFSDFDTLPAVTFRLETGLIGRTAIDHKFHFT